QTHLEGVPRKAECRRKTSIGMLETQSGPLKEHIGQRRINGVSGLRTKHGRSISLLACYRVEWSKLIVVENFRCRRHPHLIGRSEQDRVQSVSLRRNPSRKGYAG